VIVAALWLAVSAVQSRHQTLQVARTLTHGDPAAAPPIMRRYGCAGCHTIPGIPGADGQVGPDLGGLRKRVYIGGVANNTAENLVRWIVSPQSFSPRSAMPATGISESEARDVAAYLYAH
jgi:cytochrome c1